MQKHVGPTGVVCDKSESAVSIPLFQFSSTHPIFPFRALALQAGLSLICPPVDGRVP
jgi:hypothetical protein